MRGTRPGYGVVLPDGRAAFPFMLTLFAVAGIPAVLADSTGTPWLWLREKTITRNGRARLQVSLTEAGLRAYAGHTGALRQILAEGG